MAAARVGRPPAAACPGAAPADQLPVLAVAHAPHTATPSTTETTTLDELHE